MASLTTTARTFGRSILRGLVEAIDAPVAEVPTAQATPAADPFAVLPAIWDDEDITGTPGTVTTTVGPVVAPKPARPLPSVQTIEMAAIEYDQAAEQARIADRAKRKAKKVLGSLPAGIYGRARIDFEESSRLTPDLDAIAAIFAAHDLGEIPMRRVAATMRVSLLPADAA